MPRTKKKRRRSRNSSNRLLGCLAVVVVGVVVGGVIVHHAVVFVLSMLLIVAVAAWLGWRLLHTRRITAQTMAELLALTPTQFEQAVAQLLGDLGYHQVKHIGGSGDLAADIVCRDAEGRSVVVQCKRYGPAHRVGSPEIQKFIGMVTVHHHADHGLFVTTSSYTQPALALGKQHGVELIDGATLVKQLQDVRRNAAKTR
jgi:restriction system protein